MIHLMSHHLHALVLDQSLRLVNSAVVVASSAWARRPGSFSAFFEILLMIRAIILRSIIILIIRILTHIIETFLECSIIIKDSLTFSK